MRIYLAGPMRGKPGLNHAAFDRYAAMLRTYGHDVHSPAEMDRARNVDPSVEPSELVVRALLRAGISRLIDPSTEAIALMPGWEHSGGSWLEYMVAEAIGLQIIKLEPLPEEL